MDLLSLFVGLVVYSFELNVWNLHFQYLILQMYQETLKLSFIFGSGYKFSYFIYIVVSYIIGHM
jgi:hypothetical protein